MSMVITPNLHFHGDCEAAVALYSQAFHADILCMLKNEDANPKDFTAAPGCSSFVYHCEILIDGQRIMMSDVTEDPAHRPGNSISLVMTFETAEAVRNAYQILSEGAVILCPMQSTTYSSCFVSLIDKYGIRWELMTEQTEI